MLVAQIFLVHVSRVKAEQSLKNCTTPTHLKVAKENLSVKNDQNKSNAGANQIPQVQRRR